MKKAIVCSVAIAVIGLIEVVALFRGINGTYLGISLAAIGGIAGYMFGKKL